MIAHDIAAAMFAQDPMDQCQSQSHHLVHQSSQGKSTHTSSSALLISIPV